MTPEEHRLWWTNTAPPGVAYGNCFCGCGKQTLIAPETYKKYHIYKGLPTRFINHHNLRGQFAPFRGHHHTEENKIAIGLRSRGYRHTEEAKHKISDRMRGEKNPMYGVHRHGPEVPFWGHHHTEEAKRKNAEAHRGKPSVLKGRPRTEETKKKLSLQLKGRFVGPLSPRYGKKATPEQRKRLSDAKKGLKPNLSSETRAHMSARWSGENNPKYNNGCFGSDNPNWRGGLSFEPYGSEFNDKLKKQIKERDNYKCQCPTHNPEHDRLLLAAHHIDYNKKNNDPNNLITLCEVCHGKTNYHRESWALRLKPLAQNLNENNATQ